MQRRTFLNSVLASGAALALTGCGFRLRGLGESDTIVDELELAGPQSELSQELAERLRRDGTQLHAQAPWILTLGRPSLSERRLGVLDAGAREMEVVLSAPFSVQRRSDGAFVLPEQTLEVSERFTVSDDNLLAQEEIRSEAETTLRREAIRRLLERLRRLDEA